MKDLDSIKAIIRKNYPHIAIPKSLQFYPKKLGRLNDVCETCHERIKTGVLVVKEPNWEHFKCWRTRMEGKNASQEISRT